MFYTIFTFSRCLTLWFIASLSCHLSANLWRHCLIIWEDSTSSMVSNDILLYCFFDSLVPGDVIWHQRTRPTLVQAIVWCYQATSHYLNQCWLNLVVFIGKQHLKKSFTSCGWNLHIENHSYIFWGHNMIYLQIGQWRTCTTHFITMNASSRRDQAWKGNLSRLSLVSQPLGM